jgi:hypothetical protein
VPALPNQRQEQFAVLVAQGVSQTEAARQVGYKTPSVDASRNMDKPKIRARIEELRPLVDQQIVERIADVVVPTREYVLGELRQVAERAKAANDRGALLRALELMGKEIGMFVQRTMTLESPLQGLSADQLLQLLAFTDAMGLPSRPAEAPDAVPQRPMIEGQAVDNPVNTRNGVQPDA